MVSAASAVGEVSPHVGVEVGPSSAGSAASPRLGLPRLSAAAAVVRVLAGGAAACGCCWSAGRCCLGAPRCLAYPLRTPGTNMSSALSCTSSARRISRAARRVSSAASDCPETAASAPDRLHIPYRHPSREPHRKQTLVAVPHTAWPARPKKHRCKPPNRRATRPKRSRSHCSRRRDRATRSGTQPHWKQRKQHAREASNHLDTCPRGFFAPGDKFSRGHAPPAFLAQHFCPRGFFAPEACRGVGFSFQTKLKNGGQSLDLSYQCAQSKQQVSHS